MDGAEETIRILVADEQSLSREAIRAILEREPGLRVVGIASDGLDAVADVLRHRPDVVILTSSLPNCDGVQATRMIRERVPETKVLFLSAVEDSELVVSAFQAGANGFLTKNCALDELIKATTAIHRGEVPVPPRMLSSLIQHLIGRRQEQQENLQLLTRLTRREREVLALLSDGGDNETIARTLVISPQTARTHVQNVLTKLGVHSRLAAVAFATQQSIVETLKHLQGSVDMPPSRRGASRAQRAQERARGDVDVLDSASWGGVGRGNQPWALRRRTRELG